VLKGDTTVDLLRKLITNLQSFMAACSNQVGVPPGAKLSPLTEVASNFTTILSDINTKLNSTKSQHVKTS
jgi:hypothetical protein